MRDFRELVVWQKAHELTLAVYDMTTNFPQHERFGMTSQLRRTATTITTQIAQGAGKADRADFVRCLQSAHSFGSELEYILLLARDLGLIQSELYEKQQSRLLEIKKMITGLARTVMFQSAER